MELTGGMMLGLVSVISPWLPLRVAAGQKRRSRRRDERRSDRQALRLGWLRDGPRFQLPQGPSLDGSAGMACGRTHEAVAYVRRPASY